MRLLALGASTGDVMTMAARPGRKDWETSSLATCSDHVVSAYVPPADSSCNGLLGSVEGPFTL